MRSRIGVLFSFTLAFILLAPVAAHATGIPFLGPIVPPDAQTCAAGWGALTQIANNLIAFAITLLIILVAPAMIVWAGFLYVFSPTNPSMRSQANHILSSTAIGIGIALGAWLIVDTFLTTLTVYGAHTGVTGFTSTLFETTGDCLLTPPSQFNQAVGQTVNAGLNFGLNSAGNEITVSPDQACANNSGVLQGDNGAPVMNDQGQVECSDGTFVNTQVSTSVNSAITGGSCDASSFSGFPSGANASTLACICNRESRGNAGAMSGTDKTVDGQSVSVGLMQINITGTPVSCNGQTYNCPSAFNHGFSSADVHNGSTVQITNQALYQQCVQAMQNPQCNLQQASRMYSLAGLRPWGGTGSCN